MRNESHTARERRRSTKIVATLGPSSSTETAIEALARAGADVFRLNFSHGTHADHALRHAAVRAIEARIGHPIGVLLDLQGPKLRVGQFASGRAQIAKGRPFVFDRDPAPGDARRVSLPHPEIFDAARPGHLLLVDDGKLRFRVDAVSSARIETTALLDGIVSDRKGVSVPDATLAIPALSAKDRDDLEFGLSLGVDWVALSFVQTAQDVRDARALIGAKIEKPQAVANIAEIVDAADAVMVARGDLGVEMSLEDVPSVQKQIIRLARAAGKPVIVATQMLESMTLAPTPTRAEASDVAAAVYDGADAVMLSAESASGQYPVEAVDFMRKIISTTEADPIQPQLMKAIVTAHAPNATDAIGAAIEVVSDTLRLGVAVTYTASGATAIRLSRLRPSTAILSLTPRAEIARRLTLAWGVRSRVAAEATGIENIVEIAIEAAHAEGFATDECPIVVAAGVPFGHPGSTNLMRIVWPTEMTRQ
ncbi:pyruvate kinase [Burkholderia pseudomallei]|uniref:pyruvate kinase n=1 Tax=Burkholderia pseudomallei TaxID=28450 RepID=UPI00016B12A6|nr:pyruvate kinase [Burkholderia pseudomallei]AJX40960.1 pyruvate kinase [Burkholderia pseudomallei]MCD4519736.1 pyruvate kinase [Burkholderia pseudomallei]OMS84255.1 pyruvate kinase [Burkholderia pseudomallei]ONA17287.1 pyruvate kinase [Burkholderia pseudomallei]ONE86556.1 pyruvate kinase [Burkholderia pseudomallei]